ncbi:MAG: hypothetical protein ACRC8K_17435 [Waterburya sp.]
MNHDQQAEILTLPSGEPMPDGEVIIYRHFFKQSESDQFFDILFNTLNWRQEKIKFFGKEINVPRLTAWYGDEGKSYQYSGIKMNPNPWTPSLTCCPRILSQQVNLFFFPLLKSNLLSNHQLCIKKTNDE